MSDQLFESDERPADAGAAAAGAPLAVRMRPRGLDDLVGQEHLLGAGSTLRTAIVSGEPHSMVLYGPPGTGKTTIARIVATAADGAFEEESAVNAWRTPVLHDAVRAAVMSSRYPTLVGWDPADRRWEPAHSSERADAAFALGQTADSTRGVALLVALRT